MTQQLNDEDLFRLAKARVEQKKGFYAHLASYCIINAALFLVWRFGAGGGYPWFLWPLGGWGVGLAFHFVAVFLLPSAQGSWEQREIQKEMERLRNETGKK